ncbi:MAG: D-2-hydroxyacid dehydrogenase [Anaerolineales bacterium]
MKIIVPEFVLPQLREETCNLVQECNFVILNDEGEPSGDLAGAEVLMLPWRLPADVRERILSLSSLKWIHSVSAGVEHALDEQLRQMDVILTNASGVFDLPIAETVVAYILMIVKQMPTFLRQQQAHVWKKRSLREAAGLTVGLIGLGSIGTEIARLCQGLEMRVLATRRHPEAGAPHIDTLYPTEELHRLLEASDFAVIAVPLTEETRGMIGAEALRRMGQEAWLINIARGAVVDEEALIEALQEGRIAGAALDVFVEEPLPEDSPLWELENVIITPHNSWSTPHLKEREAALFLENLRHYLRDEPLRNVVNKELGY